MYPEPDLRRGFKRPGPLASHQAGAPHQELKKNCKNA